MNRSRSRNGVYRTTDAREAQSSHQKRDMRLSSGDFKLRDQKRSVVDNTVKTIITIKNARRPGPRSSESMATMGWEREKGTQELVSVGLMAYSLKHVKKRGRGLESKALYSETSVRNRQE